MGISLLLLRAAAKINTFNPTEYPRGRKMLEPVVVVGFAAVTCALTAPVIIQAITELVELVDSTSDSSSASPDMQNCSNPAIEVAARKEPPELGTAVIVCFSLSAFVNLALFGYCWRVYVTSGSEAVKALALDFRNDSANFIAAVIIISLCVAFPDAPIEWLNQIGAILISAVILKTWVGEGWQTANKLTGVAPNAGQLKDILALVHWAARNSIQEQGDNTTHTHTVPTTDATLAAAHKHDVSIAKCNHVQQVQVYHFGSNLIVEVQLIMPGRLTTKEISATTHRLRELLEEEEDIERCFVTLSETIAETSDVGVIMNDTVVAEP
jgi:divalent metal cation (Fe/Co/Zn/Cd) transporter